MTQSQSIEQGQHPVGGDHDLPRVGGPPEVAITFVERVEERARSVALRATRAGSQLLVRVC